jgi:hypothetical protein
LERKSLHLLIGFHDYAAYVTVASRIRCWALNIRIKNNEDRKKSMQDGKKKKRKKLQRLLIAIESSYLKLKHNKIELKLKLNKVILNQILPSKQ